MCRPVVDKEIVQEVKNILFGNVLGESPEIHRCGFLVGASVLNDKREVVFLYLEHPWFNDCGPANRLAYIQAIDRGFVELDVPLVVLVATLLTVLDNTGCSI